MANIHDIVRMTNLSLGTVSNYLNGKKIKEKNKKLIEETIKELDYKVNSFGRNLKTNHSGIIGIMVPNLDDPFAPKVISSVEQYLREYNFAVMICDTMGDPDIEKRVIDFFIERRVEGVVIFPAENDSDRYNCFENAGIHSVCIDMKVDGFKGDFIAVDNRRMAREATEYLILHGHRNIGILCGPRGIYSADERLKGYLDALAAADITVREEYIKRGFYTEERIAATLTEEILNCGEKITAIFASNYFFTIGATSAFNTLKTRIGEQVSLVGFDNDLATQVIIPKLTIVEQPIKEMSASAGEILISRIKKENAGPPIEKLVAGKIIEGESVATI